MLVFSVRASENRYVGFGNTVPPQKREDDLLNSAMASLYSVRSLGASARAQEEGWGADPVLAGPCPLPSLKLLFKCGSCYVDPDVFQI